MPSETTPLLPGRATPEATRSFLARHGSASPRLAQGLSLSSIGLGTYLGSDDDATDALYRESIAGALDAGLNVLDSAINYRSQRSERVIGGVLRERIESGRLRREEVFVATKAGYVPYDGTRPRHDSTWLEETYLGPGIIPRAELASGVHCMAPSYLDDQIARSRRNLGLETIDLYYLHNPESGMEGISEAEFLRRVRAAFVTLERAAGDGRIEFYGTATWHGYRKPPGKAPHHSLLRFVELANDVGGAAHHFKFIQLPYNLALIEAFATPTQPTHKIAQGTPQGSPQGSSQGSSLVPLLEAAEQHGLYVMASASLLQGQLTERLPPEIRSAPGLAELATDAQRSVQFVRSTPGIGTALVGTRMRRHIEELATVERAPPAAEQTIRNLFVE